MLRVAILILMPAVAWAHPGHHPLESMMAYLAHLLSEPDHLAMLLAVGGGLFLLRSQFRRRANQLHRLDQ